MTNGIDELLAELLEGDEIPARVSNRLILAVVLDIRNKQTGLERRIRSLEDLRLKLVGAAIALGLLGGTVGTIFGQTILALLKP